jgi:hypothetical protein
VASGYDNINGQGTNVSRPSERSEPEQSILPQHEAAVIDLVREAMESRVHDRAEERIRVRLRALKTALSSTDSPS